MATKENPKQISDLVHDLKSPLISIQGMTELLIEDSKALEEKEIHHFLERILVNAQDLEKKIRTLPDLLKSMA